MITRSHVANLSAWCRGTLLTSRRRRSCSRRTSIDTDHGASDKSVCVRQNDWPQADREAKLRRRSWCFTVGGNRAFASSRSSHATCRDGKIEVRRTMTDVGDTDRGRRSQRDDIAERREFLNYNYREPIGLAEQSIGIISGILLFSISFSDKLGGIRNSPPSYKHVLLESWAFLLLSITVCGMSMAFSWNSARHMRWGQNEVRPPRKSRQLSRFAANSLTSA